MNVHGSLAEAHQASIAKMEDAPRYLAVRVRSRCDSCWKRFSRARGGANSGGVSILFQLAAARDFTQALSAQKVTLAKKVVGMRVDRGRSKKKKRIGLIFFMVVQGRGRFLMVPVGRHSGALFETTGPCCLLGFFKPQRHTFVRAPGQLEIVLEAFANVFSRVYAFVCPREGGARRQEAMK